jgi:UDP-2,3-diacylglucosamine pyrophosphatase LpxH
MNYAAIFIFDPHAGQPESCAAQIVWFRQNTQARQWFWGGDIRDLWALWLTQKWWGESEAEMAAMAHKDRELAGNHDGLLAVCGVVDREAIYTSPVTGKEYLVAHCDDCDPFIVRHVHASILATWIQDASMAILNPAVNWVLRRFGYHGRWSVSAAIKKMLRSGAYLDNFKRRAAAKAKALGLAGVIHGHTHADPSIEEVDGVLVINGGAGVNLTAVAETETGEWVILDLMP